MSDYTIDYYNEHVQDFASSTVDVEFHELQDKFLAYLQQGASILDFGCGSGRDTKYFLSKGYQVDATDGSEELCRYASEFTGIEVKHQYFQELEAVDQYDGIWACASILHLTKKELKPVLRKMALALHAGGYIYTSFKHGDYEGERNGRFFVDFTLDAWKSFIEDIEELELVEYWYTSDARPGREDEKWLNVMMRKR